MTLHDDAPEQALFANLTAALTGELAGCAQIVLPPGSATIAARDLLDGERLAETLRLFGESHAGADARAITSMWTCWYLGVLVPPAVTACVLLDDAPALALEDIGLSLTLSGAVHAVRFTAPSGNGTACRMVRLRALLDSHLVPFAEAVAERCGLSRNLVWSNAAAYFAWTGAVLERQHGRAEATRFLGEAAFADGLANPLHGRIRAVDDEGCSVARRRVCCLRYLLPGVPGCGAVCPLPAVRESGVTPLTPAA